MKETIAAILLKNARRLLGAVVTWIGKIIAIIFLNGTGRRFIWLSISVPVGLLLLRFLNDVVDKYSDDSFLKIFLDELNILIILLPALIVSLPTAALLWWFRTHDVRQNLQQSKDTYNQSDFFDGLDRLVSDESLNIDLGVAKLIALSEKDGSHDERIHLAFSKRLKHLPKEYKDLLSEIEDIKKEIVKLEIVRLKKEQATEKEQELTKKSQELEEQARRKPKLTYAQHILKWFKAKNRTITDIDGTRFDFQEFKLDVYREKENPLVYFLGKDNSFRIITFIHAYLSLANLEGANLLRANLRGAKLLVTQLGGAKLEGANLRRADLHGANLRNAKLEWAKLEGANLQWAKLEWAKLEGANLSGAKLEGANFLWAKLKWAQLPEGIMKYPREQ